MRESTRWRKIAQEIEQQQSCGYCGLCAYVADHELNHDEALSIRVETHAVAHKASVNAGTGALLSSASLGGGLWVDNRGVWETRVLLAHFLAYEAAGEGR